MTKNELKKARPNELIVELAVTNSKVAVATNIGLGVKRSQSHLEDVLKEMISRGIISEEDATNIKH